MRLKPAVGFCGVKTLSEQYDLKKSEAHIGQLYPILEAKDGEIIDGFHREEANKNWKRVRLEHVDTEEKKIVARVAANWHRREILAREKGEWVNGLAKIYKDSGIAKGNIAKKVSERLKIPNRTILFYLDDEFKQTSKARTDPRPDIRVPASQVIISRAGEEYGKQLVERHREEVLKEEKPKIEHEVKQKLLQNPNFQREVLKEIRKPKIVKPAEACPSGVCALPSKIDSGEPIDVKAEALEQFWKDNPECLCKTCEHYGKCGVIR